MRDRGARRLGTLVLAVIGVALIVGVNGARFANQDIGYVGVVRNSGPFDGRTIRQILQPGQRLTWIGFFSQKPHEYPAAKVSRVYTMTSDPRLANRAGVDFLTVPTKDGVQVAIEASVFLRFVGESNVRVLERFDTSFGARKFRTPDGRELYPWQGDEGFYAVLDAVFRPVLEYDVRKEIGRIDCAQLVASCALVRRGEGENPVPLADADAIAKRIGKALEHDLTETIGQSYFRDIRVRIARAKLPTSVQSAIDTAQAKFAEVSAARAQLKQAQYQAKSNRLIGESLNRSPSLAQIQALKAIPRGATVFLTEGGKQPTILAGTGGANAVQQAGTGTATKSGNGG
jgi:regulator of protease activity HflC (stomatin/prohibitin superfamily)